MQQGNLETKGFLSALFDFGFTSFITLRFLKVIYALLVGLVLLSGLFFFVALLLQGGLAILVAIVGVPLVTLLYLVLARVYMEIIALFFRIGENTSVMAAALGGGGSAPGGPAGPSTDPYAGPSYGGPSYGGPSYGGPSYGGPSYGGPSPGPAEPTGSGL